MDWKYPLLFGMDLKSTYKSLWIGWWLVTWADGLSDLHISFQPGL